jgi:hypothetical protein
MCRLAKGLWCGERLVSSTAILVGQWVKSVSRRQQTVKLETGEDRGLGDNIIFFLGFFGGAGDGWRQCGAALRTLIERSPKS